MAHIVMAYIVMAYTLMAYTIMACIVMDFSIDECAVTCVGKWATSAQARAWHVR